MKKAKYTAAVPVQLTPEWRDRLRTVADHPRIEDSVASVIRDCIETALPGFELELGLVEPEEVTPTGYAGAERLEPTDIELLTGGEDRSRGCFGGPPALPQPE